MAELAPTLPYDCADVLGILKAHSDRAKWPGGDFASFRAVCRAQVGADDEGYAVRLRYKHYLTYCRTAHHGAVDDSPLYIFDGTFADREGSKAMRKDYEVGFGVSRRNG